ncbi:MAG: GYF domain-containing protein, partial [Cytophagales bacterium]
VDMSDQQWFVFLSNKEVGPFRSEQIEAFISTGQIKPADLMWRDGFVEWLPLDQIIEFAPFLDVSSFENSKSHNRDNAIGNRTSRVELRAEREFVPDDMFLSRSSFEREPDSHEFSSQKKRKANYFTRHWFGELSLAKSYWLSNILSILIVLVLTFGFSVVDFSTYPRTASGFMFFYWAVILFLSIWYFVGLMRSASAYNKKFHGRWWGYIAQMFGVLGALSSVGTFINVGIPQLKSSVEIFRSASQDAQYSLRVLRDSTELEISGRLDFGVSREFQKMLDVYPTITTIHLGSIGGRMVEANLIAEEIIKRGLDTYIAANCESACVEIFVAGRNRLISETSQVGLHRPDIPGAEPSEYEAERKRMASYFVSRGVDPSVVDRAFATDFADMWYPTHAELFSSGIATAYAGDNDVGISIGAGASTSEIVSSLENDPLYRAIKAVYPIEYEQLLKTVSDGVLKGKTIAEVRALTTPVVSKLYERSMPRASFDALLSFYKLQYAQANSLYEDSPKKCVAFLSGDVGGFEYGDIPVELKRNDTSIGAKLISSTGSYSGALITDEDVLNISVAIIQKIGEKTNLSYDEVTKGLQFQLNDRDNCRVQLIFYEYVFELPQADKEVYV